MEFNEQIPSGEPDGKPDQPVRKRPGLLSLICVLTFIGSGLSAFSYLTLSLSFETMRSLVFDSGMYDGYFEMLPDARNMMEYMFSLPRLYYVLTGLFYILSVTGAALMWNLRRIGFHLYTIAQCLLILVSMLMVPGATVPWTSLVWTALFVALYAIHLKYMRK